MEVIGALQGENPQILSELWQYIKGVPKKVSDSDFGFQVGIDEYFCFPNLFFPH